jgi:hypothetical protein
VKRRAKTRLEVYFTSRGTIIVNSIEKSYQYLYDLYDKNLHTIEINNSDKPKIDSLLKDRVIRIVYKKRIPANLYVADFETCDRSDIDGVRVYAAAIAPVANPYDVLLFETIEQFLEYTKTLGKVKIYFHNISFDGAFIVDYLFRKKEHPDTSIFSKKWYSVRYGNVEYRDSMKLLPATRIKEMPKQFNLPLQKLDDNYDYKRIRKLDEKLTDKEINYIKNDVTILGLTMQKLVEAGFNTTYLTIGAFVYAMINRAMVKDTKRNHEDIIPEHDQLLRKAYYGGYTAVNEKYKGDVINNITAIDYNSMYPSMMLYKPMPIGQPKILSGRRKIEPYLNNNYFVIVEFEGENVNLKPGRFPTLTKKGFVAQYKERFDIFIGSMVWSDFEWAKKNYSFGDLKIKKYIIFNATTGDFNEVIQGLKTLKENSSELDDNGKYVQAGVRKFAKLCLNSMYGKFAQSLVNERRLITLDDETDALREYPEEDQELGKGKYLPISIAVTAAARDELFKVYDKIGYDRIIYSDTDSIYIKDYNNEIADQVHESDFGKWSIEREGFEGKFLHAKCYMLDYGNYKDVKVAGLPKTADVSKLSFDDFKPGLNFEKIKLIPKYVHGGVRLNEVDFTIKDIK